MGINPVEIFFAGKGLIEHLVGAAEGDEQAIAGLGADALGIVQMFPKAPQTPIISAGLMTINVMQMACGIGTPDNGDRYWEGSRKSHAVMKTLDQASPTDEWEGLGSDAYETANSSQRDRARQMKEADWAVRNIVAKQSVRVISLKNFLDLEATVLSGFIIPALVALRLPPPFGPILFVSIQTGGVLGTVPPCEIEMLMMARDAVNHARSLEEVARTYDAIATGATAAESPTGLNPQGTCTPAGSPGGEPPVPGHPAPPAYPTPRGEHTSPAGNGSPPVRGSAPSTSGSPSGGGSEGAPGRQIPQQPTFVNPPESHWEDAGPSGSPAFGGLSGSVPLGSSGGMSSAGPSNQGNPGGSAIGGLLGSLIGHAAQLAGQIASAQDSKNDRDSARDKGLDGDSTPEDDPAILPESTPDHASAAGQNERAPLESITRTTDVVPNAQPKPITQEEN
ncbi:EspA/EspE family type VII secretion system effector [Mycolicibacterium baixiangningiae]|uniref:EspA/EspE family type VII secretion system effector n=1 Tax=Mycolicibacterium baixiangningiae TaxID=2761578 RepID=UPI001867306F|nr:EspA/EspE family type VII secretion system effector [Mycolicibacterium baixiangningiae]